MGHRAVWKGAKNLAPTRGRGFPHFPDYAIQAPGVEVKHCVFLTSAIQLGEWPVSQSASIPPEAHWIRV